jgi:hypothetical protein
LRDEPRLIRRGELREKIQPEALLLPAQRGSSAAPTCAQRMEGMLAEGEHVGCSDGLGFFNSLSAI